MVNFITQKRRGTTDEWAESAVIPKQGEIVLEECKDGVVRMKIGNGKSKFSDLPYPDEKIVQQIAVLDKRIDTIVNFEDIASTDPAAEVTDIRVGYDGKLHDCAGAAVRSVGTEVDDLRRSLSQFINAQAVDGLHYEDSKLYLKAGDQILEDSVVQIISGTGGGGGSSSSLKIGYITTSPLIVTPNDDAILEFSFSGTDSSGDTILQASATWKIDGKIVEYGVVKNGTNTFDATKYLKVGTSKVFLSVVDDAGNIVTKTWSVQLIDVHLESTFDDTRKYTADADIIFDYTPYGAVDKTVHFILDGKELTSATVSANISGSLVKYNLPKQKHGSHLLEVYITAKINDIDVESNHIFKDILWYDDNSSDPVIGTVLQRFTARQYDTTNIVYTVYDPLHENPDVKIYVDGKIVSSLTLEEPTNTYGYNTNNVGEHTIKIVCGKTEKIIEANIEKLDIEISPVTLGLAFDFNPVGKSNNDSNRLWNDRGVSMSVSDNFDWINGGYQIDNDGDSYFCVKSGTTATIDYKLFANDAKVTGKEVKFVFKTINVANPDAVFLSCIDNTTDKDHIGLEMRAHEASIHGQNGGLNLAYSEEDIIEFEFNITKSVDTPSMVMGYEDGVSTRPLVYDDNYSFKQINPKNIVIGSPDCDVHIYRFKVYDTSLTDVEILNNFVADARSTTEMINRYTRNQIYNENQQLTPEVLAEKCPWLRVYKVSAPHFTNNKSDKVVNTTIRQWYLDGDPVQDQWIAYNVQHSGQGTSSNNYGAAGRNLDFIMNKSGIKGQDPYFELGDGTRASKITLTRTSVPTNYLNLKVNIASSNNLTNPILAKRYNQFNPYRRPFIREDGSNIDYIKDTMEFYNCVVFIEETDPDLSTHREFADTNCHFYAIGNIGDSKKTDSSRATDPDDKYECCVEIMDVGLPLSDFPADTMMNAMGYTEDPTTKEKIYTWAKDENLGILYEKNSDGSYELTSDTSIDLNKEYYVDILEHDDFSEDYTYGWRYLGNEDDSEAVEYCKQKWIEFYRFVTTSSNEEFREHLKDYFVVDSALYYYLFTTRYCMVDNRAKNTFWHYSKTSELDSTGTPIRKWDLCWDYDNDTSLGLNNYGKQVYRYGLEDIDVDQTGIEIFRESDSTFFCRLRDLFSAELKSMYVDLESKNAWHAESFITECDNWQSQFPEELWRLDIERKYIRTYNSSFINGKGDAQFLVNMANGKMKYHRREWERNQERYMASKFQTPTAGGDASHANFRVTRPSGDLVVPVNYEFTLTPYSYMYLCVQYGNTAPVTVRAEPNVPTRVPYYGDEADIINVFSASSIRDFGDLSPLYAKTVSIGNASRIKRLLVGNDTEGYNNPSLTEFKPGTNTLLEELNLENVTGLDKSLDLKELLNLKKFYAYGTNLTGVTFAKGGKIEDVELPAVNTIKLENLMYLTDENYKLSSYDNVVQLIIEDCPNIDALALLNKCTNVTSLRLVDVDMGDTSYEYFEEKLFKLEGVDAFGNVGGPAWISGKAKFDKLTGTQYNTLHSRYPQLEILFNELTCTVEFKDTDLTTTVYGPVTVRGINSNLPGIVDPVESGKVPAPVKEKTISDYFTWNGWSTKSDYKPVDVSPLSHVTGDFTFYPTFDKHTREYTLYFHNDDETLLNTYQVKYGTPKEEYTKLQSKPQKALTNHPDSYEFREWVPAPETLTGDLHCYATYELLPNAIYDLQLSDFDYVINPLTSELTIISYKNADRKIIRILDSYEVDGVDYTVTGIMGKDRDTTDEQVITGFQNMDLEYVILPTTLRVLGSHSFKDNATLTSITIPESVEEIGDACFSRCKGLVEVYYNATAAECTRDSNDDQYPFYDTSSKTGYTVHVGSNVEYIPSMLFHPGISTPNYVACRKVVFDRNSNCHTIQSYAFRQAGVSEVNLPESLVEISNNAFSYCNLTTVVIPNNVEKILTDAFSYNPDLKQATIPESVEEISAAVFRGCPLVNFDIADQSNFRWQTGCLVDTANKFVLYGNETAQIPEGLGLEKIANYAFESVKIKTLKIPEGIKEICQYAIYDCTELESIILPSTLEKIDSFGIYNTAVTEIILPSINLQTINSFSLAHNKEITEIIIPECVTTLGYKVFEGCTNLKTVKIESAVVTFGRPYSYNTYLQFTGCNNVDTIEVAWASDDSAHEVVNQCAPWGALCSEDHPVSVKYSDTTIEYTVTTPEVLPSTDSQSENVEQTEV